MLRETMSEETPLLVSAGDNSSLNQSKKNVSFNVNLEPARYPQRKQSAHQRYQSSVIHLPKHIVDSPRKNNNDLLFPSIHPTTNTNLNQAIQPIIFEENEIPITKLDPITQKQTPYIPFIHLCLLWFNISIFTVSIIFVIIGIILASQLLQSPIIIGFIILLIICSISGLLISISYRNTIFNLLSLNTKIFDFITKTKLEQINIIEDNIQQVIPIMSLLESFRKGCFYKQLNLCSDEELKQLLPVVAQSLCQLPFGLTEFRSKLFIILADRISNNASLDQSWRFFLNCNRDIPEIGRTWENHEYLKPEKYNDYDDKKEKDTQRKDSVLFFRSLFKDLKKTGSRKSIDRNDFICDPINGNILIEIQLKKIMPSNAKPYLIDCYTFDKSTGYAVLSSKMLLKQGDDLRKDLGVMLIFKFMNELWIENEINYNGQRCHTLVYDVIPMAVDFGVIEFIEGADKVAHIDEIMKENKENKSEEYDIIMDRLIGTAAASYVASYVIGVRDRHHDNILVRNDGTLFNIDMAYILGEKLTGLDASKIAIPTKFVKVLGNERWNKFLEIVVICFNVLRNNYVQLLDYSRIVFAFMKTTDENEKYLKQSLFIDLEEKEALKKIKALFVKAPSQIKTKMKNVIHSLAVKGKNKSVDT
eukprot:49912_1